MHLNAGNYPAALEHYQRALAIHEELGEPSGVARVTGNVVSTLISSKEYSEAQAMLQRMDALQIDEPGIIIVREQCRAQLQHNEGEVDQAVETLTACLEIAREHSLAAATSRDT